VVVTQRLCADLQESPEIGLPARFRHSRKQSRRGILAECNTGEAETAEESTATTGDLAAIHHPGRAGIAGKHRETDVILLLLELAPKVGEFINGVLFALIAGDPTFLSPD
jgi:hypothetical protein